MVRQLRYVGERVVLALVCPDLDDPSLVRVHWRDGEVSDRLSSVSVACAQARREASWRYPEMVLSRPHWFYWEVVEVNEVSPSATKQMGW